MGLDREAGGLNRSDVMQTSGVVPEVLSEAGASPCAGKPEAFWLDWCHLSLRRKGVTLPRPALIVQDPSVCM